MSEQGHLVIVILVAESRNKLHYVIPFSLAQLPTLGFLSSIYTEKLKLIAYNGPTSAYLISHIH